MFSTILLSYLLSLVSAHGVILAAQGEKGSPASIGFQVDTALARNCTSVSPCQQDTTIIRNEEISQNIVNQCGRTELSGNIDVGENTENQLSAGTVTSVKAGTVMAVTIHQVNADGAGPYECDIDMTSNSGTISQNLTVTNNVPGVNGLSQAKTQDFTINVAMPANLACTGASTGNICTVRCRNNAVAGPFGGCFAVQQSDITPTVNSADTIGTAQTGAGISKQILQNQADLPAAIAANQNQGTDTALKAQESVNALLGLTITSKASPTQTLVQENVGSSAAATVAASSASGKAASGTKATKSAAVPAGAAATTSAAAAASTKAAKGAAKGNANAASAKGSNKRDGTLRWAKRAVDVRSEE